MDIANDLEQRQHRSRIFGSTGAGTITVANSITLNGINFTATGYTPERFRPHAEQRGQQRQPWHRRNQVAPSLTATINASIGGSVGLTKTNAGTLILGGTGTFTGTTSVTAGTLETTGTMNNSATVGSGATLQFAQSNGATISNTISGAGTIAFSGATVGTTFILSSTSSNYTGPTLVQFGTLRLGAANAIPYGSRGHPRLRHKSGRAGTRRFNDTIQGLASSGTGASQVNDFGGTGTNVLTMNGAQGTTYAGLLGGTSTNNNNNFAIILGAGGKQYLTNSHNNYTGGTTIAASGVLSVPNVGALGSGSLTLNGNSTSSGSSESAAIWQYTGPTASTARPTILNSTGGSINVTTTGATLTMSGVISETGGSGRALTVFGDGNSGATLVLTAANTYTGPTIIDLGGVQSIATIANGGVASPLGMASNAPANIQLGGIVSGGGTLLYTGPTATNDRGVTLVSASYNAIINVSNSNTTLTMSGQFTGAAP